MVFLRYAPQCIRSYEIEQHEMDGTPRNAVIGKTIIKSG
jgi:hypothetical protein